MGLADSEGKKGRAGPLPFPAERAGDKPLWLPGPRGSASAAPLQDTAGAHRPGRTGSQPGTGLLGLKLSFRNGQGQTSFLLVLSFLKKVGKDQFSASLTDMK